MTYFATFESETGGKSDRLEKFSFWSKKPKFIDWLDKQRKDVEEIHKKSCVIINCNIIH